ncbi:zinc finger CCHC domain-containing protein 10-like [Watersipora subatra]|uniref:zinc finger CCHC domain-containing protein 10-like n=1 Tax=Watersipora subatra TaxID=2589382 RepID=UPI00355C890A
MAMPPKLLVSSLKTSATVQCQKCQEKGHWTYECTNERKYLYRPSRTKEMKKDLKRRQLEKVVSAKKAAQRASKRTVAGKLKKDSSESSGSSDSSSDSSDSSGSDSDSASSSSSSSDSGTGSSDSSSSTSDSSSSSEEETPKKKRKRKD